MIVTSTVLNVQPGQTLTCRYPEHGDGSTLVDRKGVVEFVGRTAKNGPYITLKLGDGMYRNLSTKRIVDPVISA